MLHGPIYIRKLNVCYIVIKCGVSYIYIYVYICIYMYIYVYMYVMNNRQLYSKPYIGVESTRFLQTSIFNYFEPEILVIMKACHKHQ